MVIIVGFSIWMKLLDGHEKWNKWLEVGPSHDRSGRDVRAPPKFRVLNDVLTDGLSKDLS